MTGGAIVHPPTREKVNIGAMVKPALILVPQTNLLEDQPYDDPSYGRICRLLGTGRERADTYRVRQLDTIRSPFRSDPRGAEQPLGRPTRDILIPALRLESGIVPGSAHHGDQGKAA